MIYGVHLSVFVFNFSFSSSILLSTHILALSVQSATAPRTTAWILCSCHGLLWLRMLSPQIASAHTSHPQILPARCPQPAPCAPRFRTTALVPLAVLLLTVPLLPALPQGPYATALCPQTRTVPCSPQPWNCATKSSAPTFLMHAQNSARPRWDDQACEISGVRLSLDQTKHHTEVGYPTLSCPVSRAKHYLSGCMQVQQ